MVGTIFDTDAEPYASVTRSRALARKMLKRNDHIMVEALCGAQAARVAKARIDTNHLHQTSNCHCAPPQRRQITACESLTLACQNAARSQRVTMRNPSNKPSTRQRQHASYGEARAVRKHLRPDVRPDVRKFYCHSTRDAAPTYVERPSKKAEQQSEVSLGHSSIHRDGDRCTNSTAAVTTYNSVECISTAIPLRARLVISEQHQAKKEAWQNDLLGQSESVDWLKIDYCRDEP